MVQKKAIEATVTGIVSDVREFSRQQKDLWQKVPYLALQADGRIGYSDLYKDAYTRGYWALWSTREYGFFTVHVDLETGELVRPYERGVPARDHDVLKVASSIDQIDAELVIKELKERAALLHLSFYDKKTQEKWRDQIIKDKNLKPDTYKRR